VVVKGTAEPPVSREIIWTAAVADGRLVVTGSIVMILGWDADTVRASK